jgi:hypothetical protein
MTPGIKHPELLAIDAANGIGAQKLIYLRQTLSDILPIEVFNDGTKGHLNEKVNEYLTKSKCFFLLI